MAQREQADRIFMQRRLRGERPDLPLVVRPEGQRKSPTRVETQTSRGRGPWLPAG